MKTGFFNGGDFGGLFRRRPRVTHISDPDAPKEVQELGKVLQEIQPHLEKLVRVARAIPVKQPFLDIGVMVDGKPANFHFKDNYIPEEFRKIIPVPHNLPMMEDAPRVPKADLVASIEHLLRKAYPMVIDEDVLGAIWSPHHNAAIKIAEILEKSRDRDRKMMAKEIGKLLDGLQY